MGRIGTPAQQAQFKKTHHPDWLSTLDRRPAADPVPMTRQVRRRRERPWLKRPQLGQR